MTVVHSVTDLPVRYSKVQGQGGSGNQEDALNISRYTETLSEFVRDCATPMTIAIQGDWGSGKTSFMNLIAEKLSEDASIKLLEFNTWQYSQFNMGENLILALIAQMMELLGETSSRSVESDERKKRILHSIKTFASTGGRDLAYEVAKLVPLLPIFVKATEQGIEAYQHSEMTDPYADFRGNTALLETMKEDLWHFVSDALNASSAENRRLVVFIDDLDRLEPAKAVEMLEALKLFLDLENCVFVLAIDFEVIKQGVRAKYGADFNALKAQAFFDKIIQVPFHMPVGVYDTSNWLIDHLKIKDRNEQDRSHYLALVEHSIGKNPRSLKRLINTFSLLRSIADKEKKDAKNLRLSSDKQDLALFAVLCLQAAYPLFYRDFQLIAATASWATNPTTEAMLSNVDLSDEGDYDYEAIEAKWGVRELEVPSLVEFMYSFGAVFESLQDDTAGDLFASAMQMAAVTSVGNASAKSDVQQMKIGEEATLRDLQEKGVKFELIELFTKITRKVRAEGAHDKFGRPFLETAIGIQPEAKFYVNPDPTVKQRGTFAEIGFQQGTLKIRLGRTWMDREELLALVRDLENAGYTVSNRIDAPNNNFRIEVQKISPDMNDEQHDVLSACLITVQKLSVQHFGLTETQE